MSSQLVLELPRASQAPGIARRWLAESFAEELNSLAQETAKLLVSELVTNALVHGRGRMEIRTQLDGDRLFVEVIDEGPGFTPTVRESDPDIAGGWGFQIVDEEASRWGIREGAAAVWFELPRHLPGSTLPEHRDAGSARRHVASPTGPSVPSACAATRAWRSWRKPAAGVMGGAGRTLPAGR